MKELELLYEQFRENYERASKEAHQRDLPHNERQRLLTEAITWCDAMLVITARQKQLLAQEHTVWPRRGPIVTKPSRLAPWVGRRQRAKDFDYGDRADYRAGGRHRRRVVCVGGV